MGIPQNSAAIDTDFLNHVVSMKHSQSDISTLLINMFSALYRVYYASSGISERNPK